MENKEAMVENKEAMAPKGVEAGEESERESLTEDGASSGSRGSSGIEYSGWVYHLGVNSIGHEYCHLRFLLLRGKYVAMYKRDPHEFPDIKTIRKGVISHTLMVEEVGRRNVDKLVLYVLRFYNRLDQTKKGEIACSSPGEARKWIEAFEQAKQQADFDLLRGSGPHRLSAPAELNLDGHRPRVRRYAQDLGKLIRIGKGPESFLRQASDIGTNGRASTYFESDSNDAFEAHEWKCVHAVNGIRILADVANSKRAKGVLLKSVGVVEANLDTVFELVLSLERQKRYEWDTLTGHLELVESIDGHCDIVYGIYDTKYLSWGSGKRDFVFSRRWLRGQEDGAYTILQFPAVHKKKPPISGYRRTKVNPSIWEIRRLNASSLTPKCLVTHMLEIRFNFWDRWKRMDHSTFVKTLHYAFLCQIAGLREYFGAHPALTSDSPSRIMHSKIPGTSSNQAEMEGSGFNDEFYDAIANGDSLEDEDSDDDYESPKARNLKLKNVSWAIAGFAFKRSRASLENSEFNGSFLPITIDPSQFRGSLRPGNMESDSNCWSSPGGQGFMIRGKTYLKDSSKIIGGDPLLKLVAVDWFKAENCIDAVALHPKCLVQSEAGRKLPFVLVINLQIPAKPNYSLVLYYGAERPVNKGSLLGRFIDGTDVFRDARFKLIPSITEGYWMVKRAVGTKACLLGKAVTCKYLRQDNFLEIDVDIGSSSVARSIISLVLGYVTGIVVDLAILIEAKEEEELPEYILGTVRLNRLRPDTAISF